MGQFLNKIRAKLGLEPRRDTTLTGKTPNEVIISRVTQNEAADPSAPGNRPVVLAPARMNPPTIGHGVLMRQVMDTAKQYGAPHHVILTRTHDVPKKKTGAGVKNPLTPEQKVMHARRFFPGMNIEAAHPDRPNLLSQASELHRQGHNHLIVVAGSDRVPEYEKLLKTYNGHEGKHGYYNFKKITVVPAGAERDENATGAAAVSGTSSRKAAEAGNFDAWRKATVPSHVGDSEAKQLFHHLRSGMGVNNTVSEASEGYPVAAIPTRPIPTKDARDSKGKKSSLNNLPSPENKGNIGLDSDLGDGKKNFNLLRRRALKRAVQVGFLEGYDDIGSLDTTKAPESNAPTTSKIVTTHIDGKRIKAMKSVKAEGTFTDVPGEQGSPNYGSDVNNSSDDTMIRTSKSTKKFKSVREVYELVNDRAVAANKQRYAKQRYNNTGIVPGSATPTADAMAKFLNKGGQVKKYNSRGEPIGEELLHERGEDKKGYFRSTESGAGITRKGAKAMGIKTAVTTPPSKLDPKGEAAGRRRSFCARMGGMKGPMKDEKGRPTRKAMSLRRWHCEEIKYDDGDEGHTQKAGQFHRGDRVKIKKDGYTGKGNIDMYDPSSDSYVVATDKHGSNLHLKASEIEAIKEAKARPYVKPHMENGKQVGYKSSDGYHVKYWRLADSALEKAKQHAKVDTVSESSLTDRVKAIMEGTK